jgi:hypothetical protein
MFALRQNPKALARSQRSAVSFMFEDSATCANLDCVKFKLTHYPFFVGPRDADSAHYIMRDVASRLTNRIQLTTDGFHCYLNAVDAAFGNNIDYAMLVKMYGTDPQNETRYSPSICWSAESRVIRGNPDRDHINTSYVERQNLSMRMGIRRFTRLTNAFSKKLENHIHALSIYFMHYNFVRIHQSLRCSPAMEAGIVDHLWSIEEIVQLLH